MTMQRIAAAATFAAITLATVAAFAGWETRTLAALLAAAAALTWLLPTRTAVRGYLASLGVQLPHTTGLLFRPAIADLFLIPALAKTFLANPRDLWPRTHLRGPIVLMSVAFAVAVVVGYFAVSRVTGYVVVNKTLGMVFLMAGAMLLTHWIRSMDDLIRAMRYFIAGVSITNLLVLVAVPLSLSVWPNEIYIVGSYRLFGTMLNPTAYGGLITTAAMFELGLLRLARPGWTTRLRWVNVWLMGLSVALTLSRSSWLAAGAAGAALLFFQIVQPGPRLRARPLFWSTAAVWTVLPALMMASILYANRNVELLKAPEERAAELHAYLVDACSEQNLPDCDDVKGSPQQRARESASGAKPGAPRAVDSSRAPDERPAQTATPAVPEVPEVPVVPTAEPEPDPSVTMRLDGPLMNARGFQDRFAIIGVAWRDYTQSISTIVFGIGLGTFLETSEADFGVRLIIHNTYAWFLMELGILGAAAFLWFMTVTFLSLYQAWRVGGQTRAIAGGLLAAAASMLVFFMFNEGFYQRHFWLLFVLAERLHTLAPDASEPAAS